MNGIEMGREALKYVEKTAIEISGIGPAQRAWMHSMSMEKGAYGLANSKLQMFGDGLRFALSNGTQRIAFPWSQKANEDSGYKVGYIDKGGVDLIVDIGLVVWAFSGHGEGALIAKLGYNTLAQIAPDVAKLAKGKIFQRAR